jgi:hypothetical protein
MNTEEKKKLGNDFKWQNHQNTVQTTVIFFLRGGGDLEIILSLLGIQATKKILLRNAVVKTKEKKTL